MYKSLATTCDTDYLLTFVSSAAVFYFSLDYLNFFSALFLFFMTLAFLWPTGVKLVVFKGQTHNFDIIQHYSHIKDVYWREANNSSETWKTKDIITFYERALLGRFTRILIQ